MSDGRDRAGDHRSGPGPASTAARADAFILPDSLQFAEYNAREPRGPAYSQRLAELFDASSLMTRSGAFDVRFYTPMADSSTR
jgi:hypothetical protein